MAELEVNVDQFIDVDVDVQDFLDACSESEIEEVIYWLSENDYKLDMYDDANEDLVKLISVISLTTEDEILIKQIANKYP